LKLLERTAEPFDFPFQDLEDPVHRLLNLSAASQPHEAGVVANVTHQYGDCRRR